MSQKKCTCPSYEGLTYDEIIEVSSLLKRKDQSKNCCEAAGWICPTLNKALRDARDVKDRQERARKGKKDVTTVPVSSKRNRVLRKKKLSLRS